MNSITYLPEPSPNFDVAELAYVDACSNVGMFEGMSEPEVACLIAQWVREFAEGVRDFMRSYEPYYRANDDDFARESVIAAYRRGLYCVAEYRPEIGDD